MKTIIVCLLIAVGIFAVGGFIGRSFNQKKTNASPIIRTSTPTKLNSYKIYDLVNDYRASKGLNKLVFDPSMCDYTKTRLSQVHTDWSHKEFWDNLPPYNVPKTWAGENLGKGYNSDQQTVTAWIHSPEHLENIIKFAYTRTCIETDTINDTTYAVQEFASY